MGYLLPRAIIVLIAWGTTCLVMNAVTAVDPLVLYAAGGVWAFVGLISFGYMHKLRRALVIARSEYLAAHDPFGKPASAFPDMLWRRSEPINLVP